MLISPGLRKLFTRKPARLISISFVAVILVGTLLLCLPVSSKSGNFTPFLTSFFTATSATCVTGLVVVDTYLYWSVFGQIIILSLIQIGGLGLITLTIFFNLIFRRKIGMRGMLMAQESVNSDTFSNIHLFIKKVVIAVLAFEGIGALILSARYFSYYGSAGIFTGIFTAVSAFCNAGFDILGHEGAYSSLVPFAGDPVIVYTVAALIVTGGLGFIVWNDIYEYRTQKKLMLHTRIVLRTTLVLLVAGTLLIFCLEYANQKTIGDFSLNEKIRNSFFQSVTCRTAGFNTVPISDMTSASKIVSCILMFIGAAPGSTGGGIKVTTFTILFMTIVCVIKGRSNTVIFNRKVTYQIVYKALAIAGLSLVLIFIVSFAIFGIESNENHSPHFNMLNVLYETISAYGTVGLSSSLTPTLQPLSRFLLSVTMFLGRVGPLSFAISIATQSGHHTEEVLSEGKVIVG